MNGLKHEILRSLDSQVSRFHPRTNIFSKPFHKNTKTDNHQSLNQEKEDIKKTDINIVCREGLYMEANVCSRLLFRAEVRHFESRAGLARVADIGEER